MLRPRGGCLAFDVAAADGDIPGTLTANYYILGPAVLVCEARRDIATSMAI